ncbi:DUF58 domain-containing protein [Pseudoduganella buxea]|uniref:DUF58 domain-containing protein n=1 Tax=Pseudoduganella buxea TaxID=1949069 RepID=A0A6I3T137_9BURK|nr:DUF58 domain-containing protein [Pseudoduganella buxea]MTV53397.1 DUF58 domain-containing protein [Pseudoduganella buxea]GGC19973.1 hypothetical protein GCM10011572_46700 [Pseudoduganella buxea]
MLQTSTLVAHAANLDLVIRHVLAGLGHGIHAGRERGAGVEFSEYRAYAPGDEWRRVDWKLLARADRYYVREAERDSHVAVWLWLDASASMGEPSYAVQDLDKLWFARTALACVAAIAQRQGDAFGLVVCSGGKVDVTPPSRGPRQLQRVFAALARTSATGALPDAAGLRPAMQLMQVAPTAMFAASDCLDWPSPLAEALQRLRAQRHDVRLLALRTQAEVDGSFPSGVAYRDRESGQGLHRLLATDREAYRANIAGHYAGVAAHCRRHDIALAQAIIEQPLEATLRHWLRVPGGRG